MKFSKYYISNNEGKSNCVIRTFCKIFGEDYNDVYNELCEIAKELNCDSFNDIPVFEMYMNRYNMISIDYGKDMQIKDLNLDNGIYSVFCWDKKDFYHMVSIIDNILFDRTDDSLDLYAITIYKQKTLVKK